MYPWSKLAESTTYEVVIPALILVFLFGFFALVLLWAQLSKDNKFDVANFLRDAYTGKESSERAFGFVCLSVHTWWVATLVIQRRDTFDHFLYYGIIWAGTPVLLHLVKRWTGSLPFTPAAPPGVDSQTVQPAGKAPNA